jgi:hypothetical protein
MTYPHGPRSKPGDLIWPTFPGARESAAAEAAPPPSSILERVGRWPLARRQIWAARALELHALGGRSLEACEAAAAEELEQIP